MVELRGQKLVKLLLEIKRELDVISVYLIGMYSFSEETLSACIINQDL